MLWNWYIIDACFLSSSCHVTTNGLFAGSVLGVFFLTMGIEPVRRLAREYDRRLILAARVFHRLAITTPLS
jgi:copper transporter 1